MFNFLISWLRTHERYASPAALFAGFFWDVFTIGRPDQFYENAILLGHLLVSGAGIIILSLYQYKNIHKPFLLLLIQFSFGSLIGSLLVLYGKSGTFEGSAFFLFFFGALLVGNEFLRDRYARMHFNMSVWYFLLLMYLILIAPVVIGKIGDTVFIASGILSFGIIAGFFVMLDITLGEKFRERFRRVLAIIAVIFVTVNGLYFLNILPPVPLALSGGGIYHYVEKEGDFYYALYEKPRWYEIWRDTHSVFTWAPGERAYCFSSVFAPTGLSAPIYHRFEYYDEAVEEWVASSRISFPIIGGRDAGYRGYSIKENLTEGRWRCNVETERGALIGRITFQVVSGKEAPIIHEEIL